jgi:hypothetical protein
MANYRVMNGAHNLRDFVYIMDHEVVPCQVALFHGQISMVKFIKEYKC